MTSDIPDDVVERALSTYWDADWTGACMDETYKGRTDAMRAALAVAEPVIREQCAEDAAAVAKEHLTDAVAAIVTAAIREGGKE